jgi:hypothetical protein
MERRKTMRQMEISYQDLRGVDPAYVEKLRRREEVIRQAIDERGRHDASVRWSYVDDGSRNYVFRLIAATDQNDCIVQVSPLDLTLEPEQFEQILAEGKRSCGDIPQ